MSLSSADLVIPHLTPGNYASSNTITVNIATNNAKGYTLTAKVGDKNSTILNNNNLVNTTNSNINFTSLLTSDSLVASNFDDNKWGYTTASTIDSNAKYSGLLYNVDTVINATKNTLGMPQSSEYPGTNTTNFTIAARAGDSQASGEYTNIINFRGVANVSTDIAFEYMQDLSTLSYNGRQELLNYLTEGTAYQLKDSRDDTVYNVAKLKDGNIWLLDNLALDPATLKAGVTLDSTNTNLPTGTTFNLPNSTTTGFTWDDNSFMSPAINTESKDISQPLAIGQSGTGKIGVYYNYCAASAGTYCRVGDSDSGGYNEPGDQTALNNAEYDICPKGWRMPASGLNGEFQILRWQYASDAEYALALKMALSGYFASGSMHKQGDTVGFWSSTYYNTNYMYELTAGTAAADFQDRANRFNGLSVRCVFDAVSDMQNISTNKLAELMPNNGDTVYLEDNRDGTIYKIGKLADGKYWMLNNLALDPAAYKSGTTLTTANTNMSPSVSFTLSEAASVETASYTEPRIDANYKNTTVGLAMGQGGTEKVGVYYNYCAASAGTYCMAETAGSGNASYDICPKEWRMPTLDEYIILTNAYDSMDAFALAFRAPLSGQSFGSQGKFGLFWSSSFSTTMAMTDWYTDSTIVASNSNIRIHTVSVRCVKK